MVPKREGKWVKWEERTEKGGLPPLSASVFHKVKVQDRRGRDAPISMMRGVKIVAAIMFDGRWRSRNRVKVFAVCRCLSSSASNQQPHFRAAEEPKLSIILDVHL